MADLQPGLVGEVRRVVGPGDLARAYGSGSIDVFATPGLVALMEQAACAAVESLLEPGSTTVGTRVDVRHLAATPPGLEVRARAELVEVDGRRLVFAVSAYDSAEKVGDGVHERAIVNGDRLLARAAGKLGS